MKTAPAKRLPKPPERKRKLQPASADTWRNIDFRKHPEKYRIGRGEQGVLTAEPYKSEMLPHWKFATPAAAKKSAAKLYAMYQAYKQNRDFVGMDLARKFIQMGYTRARRYATHQGGRKYGPDGIEIRLETEDTTKAQSALIFKAKWDKIRKDPTYQKMRNDFTKTQSNLNRQF
jgi:hypothetical protein